MIITLRFMVASAAPANGTFRDLSTVMGRFPIAYPSGSDNDPTRKQQRPSPYEIFFVGGCILTGAATDATARLQRSADGIGGITDHPDLPLINDGDTQLIVRLDPANTQQFLRMDIVTVVGGSAVFYGALVIRML